MKNVTALLAVLLTSAIVVAACSKNSSSTTSSSETTAPTAAAEASAMGNSMSNTSGGKALPIALSKLPNATVGKGDAKTGSKVFAANCESCHGAGGKNGQVGPTLAGMGLKAGQVAYMVRSPQAIDKDSSMPKLPLSAKDVSDVAAYVASLK
ncbi:MAG: cytochrome c [Candidatus Eremiobacteraeota bacterium]|nr:cytochrome c [Candidatus Eremiobacteraeota bacterium]